MGINIFLLRSRLGHSKNFALLWLMRSAANEPRAVPVLIAHEKPTYHHTSFDLYMLC